MSSVLLSLDDYSLCYDRLKVTLRVKLKPNNEKNVKYWHFRAGLKNPRREADSKLGCDLPWPYYSSKIKGPITISSFTRLNLKSDI